METSPKIQKTPRAKKTKELPCNEKYKLWFYKIRITLKVHTKVTRTIILPAQLRLDQVHDVIQNAFGWYDCHLHCFETRYGNFSAKSVDDFDNDDIDEREVRLCDVLNPFAKSMVYEYDFGDSWDHKITLMSADYNKPIPQPIYCEKAVGATPPEDCGGIGGYYSLCEALANKDHSERARWLEWLEWIGRDSEDDIIWPDKVDLEVINDNLDLDYFPEPPIETNEEEEDDDDWSFLDDLEEDEDDDI